MISTAIVNGQINTENCDSCHCFVLFYPWARNVALVFVLVQMQKMVEAEQIYNLRMGTLFLLVGCVVLSLIYDNIKTVCNIPHISHINPEWEHNLCHWKLF